MGDLTELAERWRADLAGWAIPAHITAAVGESPWVLPRQVFARRADRLAAEPDGPSYARAQAALKPSGELMDVGSGAVDVVTCHHVLYNAPDPVPFLAALTAHARRRVVVETAARHPLTALNPLWLRFHGLARPADPTADDLVAICDAMGLPARHEAWTRPGGPDDSCRARRPR